MNEAKTYSRLATEVIENFSAVNSVLKGKRLTNEEIKAIWSEILDISNTLNMMDLMNNPPQKTFYKHD